MNTIVINPKSEKEYSLLMDLLKKMRVKTKVLNEEDKEDIALLNMMMEVDRNDLISEDEIMEILDK